MKQLRDGLTTVKAMLRELFDESAYARFLSRKQKPYSRESYREFLQELEERKRNAPRCC